MKLTAPILTLGRFTVTLKYFFLLLFIPLVHLTEAQTLKNPIVSLEPSCGANNILLRAESEVIDDSLTFVWYDRDFNILGQKKGPNGWDEFITPYLVKDEDFYVSLELNGIISKLTKVTARIIHTPIILGEPWIELCGNVTLQGSIQLYDDFNNIQYQWQKLTAKDDTEVVYQSIDGENDLLLTVTEPGIFRLVVVLDDCFAISEAIQVTNDLVAEALPVGENDYCYTVNNAEEESVSFISGHYRNGLTTAEWYRSDDGGATYTVLLSNADTVEIVKPPSIIDTDETWYYRLIVTEQNCSNQNDFEINWNAMPRGSIQHKNGSPDNFFYCEADAADTRTLEAISADNVSVSWYKLLDTQISKETHELRSLISGIDMPDKELFTLIGVGNEIVLDQSMGGLIIAEFEDLDNGCKEYSSNSIFADTSFPLPTPLFEVDIFISSFPFNGVCLGQANIELSSWDSSPDSFFWYFSDDNTTYDLVGSAETYLINSIDNPGEVEGFYKMGVEKNGCYAESDPFYIFEFPAAESIIEASSTQFCQTSDVVLSSQNQSSSYRYKWYEVNDPDSTLSKISSFTPLEAGSYVLNLSSGICETESEPIQIDQLPIPEANFSTPVDTNEKFCATVSAQLIEQNTDDTYTWYRSTNNFNFEQISDESSLDYLITEKGFYFATTTNSAGCQVNSDTIHLAGLLDGELNFEEIAFTCDNSAETLIQLESPQSNQTYLWQYSPDNIVPYIDANGVNNLVMYSATEPGYYRLELVGEFCELTTDPVEVRAAPDEPTLAPVVIEATSTEFCQTSDIMLSSQYQGQDYVYSWFEISQPDSTISSESSFNPLEAGSYALKLDSGICTTTQSDPIEITQLPISEANFSTPVDTNEKFCASLNAQLIEQNTDDTYAWYHSLDNFSFVQISDENSLNYLTTEKGFYFATITNNLGCQVSSDTLHVVDLLDDELNYEEIAFTCADNQETLLWLKSPQSNQTYLWFYSTDNIVPYTEANGTNNLVIYSAMEPGFYRMELTGEFCTQTTDPVEVRAAPDQPDIEVLITGEESACSGTPITLTNENEENISSYLWFYSIEDGELSTFIGEGEKTLTFDAAQFTNDANPTQEVNVYLAISEGNCSSISAPLTVQAIKQPEISVRNNINNTEEGIFICNLQNTTINLEAFQVPTGLSVDYQWSKLNSSTLAFDTIQDANLKVLDITNPGVYQCTGTVPGTICSATSNTLEVTATPSSISGDTTFCYGGFFDIQVDQAFLLDDAYSDFTFQWYYGSSNQTFSAIDTAQSHAIRVQSGAEGINGGYFYYLASYNTCNILSDTLFVDEDEASIRITLSGEQDQIKGEPFEISATTDQEENIVTWGPTIYAQTAGVDRAIFTIPEDYTGNQIEILAQVTNETCTSSQQFLVNLTELESINFSKIITPNGDNHNDIFRIKGLSQSTPNVLRIFDGWGKMIYEVNDYDNSSMAGDELMRSIEEGNFYYVFSVDGQTYKGNFYVKK